MREFSRRSRTRLQQTLCAIPVEHVGRGLLFITLTYPASFPGNWTVWKQHLATWLKRVRRKFPRAGGTWKLEPQKRGAPHFHLLTVGVPFIAREWVSTTWYDVVGSRDPKHLAAGTNIQLARSHKGVVSYASKYTAKRQELPVSWQGGVGRWWGVFARANLGIAWAWWPLTQPQYWQAIRTVRALIARRPGKGTKPPPWSRSNGTWAVLRSSDASRLVSLCQTIRPFDYRGGRPLLLCGLAGCACSVTDFLPGRTRLAHAGDDESDCRRDLVAKLNERRQLVGVSGCESTGRCPDHPIQHAGELTRLNASGHVKATLTGFGAYVKGRDARGREGAPQRNSILR